MIPYCLIVGYFASIFAWDSLLVGEKSASTVGLSYRWIIKSILVIGIFTALLAGIAVWLQTVIALFGPARLRFKLMTLEWPEDAAARGGKLTSG
jgi:TRAP-type mannitol/chloroaromatic compound transport system permease small subunit